MSDSFKDASDNADSAVPSPLSRRDFLCLSAAAGVYGASQLQSGQAATAQWKSDGWTPSPLETRIVGMSTVLPRSRAALRIITLDHRSGAAVRNAGVRVALKVPNRKGGFARKTLFTGYTDKRGTLEATFRVPDLKPGSYELLVSTTSPLGSDSFNETLQVAEAAQVLLTADKPLYQPNQTIHMRALCLAKPDLKPVVEKLLIFEVEDAKGNKVFKKQIRTSKFGVAGAKFVLGDEINLGSYTIRAILDELITEKTVSVEKYVLPKFKVALSTAKKYYQPGETLKGTLQADYFFGKPVDSAQVTVKAATFDIGFRDFAEIKGKTGPSGAYEFEMHLPEYFAGLPLAQGKALVKLEAVVKDSAEHSESITQTVPIATEAIKIVVLPESGALIPGVENTIFILSNYPDGEPAPTRFTFKSNGIDLSGTTDTRGIGEVKLTPQGNVPRNRESVIVSTDSQARPIPFLPLEPRIETEGIVTIAPNDGPDLRVIVEARDAEGNEGKTAVDIARYDTQESLILRADRPLANVGEILQLEVLSTDSGTAYLDLIKDSQMVLSKSIALSKGRGTFQIALDETLIGTLQANAYIITPKGEMVRDTKLLYVNAANDLKIAINADEQTYRPGKPAQIDLNVTNRDGQPVIAALGVNIVDESVFALQEMQPGLEKIYFTLEKELLEPQVEIHGFEADGIVPLADETPLPDSARQKAARVLFAAAQPDAAWDFEWNSYDDKWQALVEKWRVHLQKETAVFGNALAKYHKKHGKYPPIKSALQALINERLLPAKSRRDPLGTPYRLEPGYGNFNNGYQLMSAGPDKKFGTNDDVSVFGWISSDLVRPKSRVLRASQENAIAPALAMPAAGMSVTWANPASPGPPGPPVPAKQIPQEVNSARAEKAKSETSADPVRVRKYFPETLFAHPNVLTDESGRAQVELAMADSITTWRLTTMASSAQGALGSATAPLRVFQDFFVDLDLPVALTQNDEIEIPVAVYNYLPQSQSVRLKLETSGAQGQWFELVSDDAEKTITLAPNQVGATHFRLAAREVGQNQLMVTARGTQLSDAIQREIEVRPDGRAMAQTFNDRLQGSIAETITIPPDAIAGASNIIVRLYPGAFSQVVDGLDQILQMPYGCFEQNASVTYPNLLVMDYLKKTRQLKPLLQMKAESYINAGYQRALSYEVPGGGFSLYGDAPASQFLTAYGLMMFHDMSRVHHVDANVLQRTQRWLVNRQKPDGSWAPDNDSFGETLSRQSETLRVTAYVLWSLAESGFKGKARQRAAAYLSAKMNAASDAYTLAIIANALVANDRHSSAVQGALQKLAARKNEAARVAYWKNLVPTCCGSRGESADVETTALAAYALLRSQRYTALANKALAYLVAQKDAQGTWGNTQATIWSLRALLAGVNLEGAANGKAIIKINGEQAGSFVITPQDADVMQQIELKEWVQNGANKIEIQWAGKGSALYAISGQWFVPWGQKDKATPKPLEVIVNYDRTELAVNDMVTCRVQITNRRPLAATNLIVDLGIPPGFEVQSEDFAELVGSKKISKFNVTGRQVILYIDRLEITRPLRFSYRLKAKFPLKAQTPKTVAYEYYTPSNRAESRPVSLTVKKA